MGSYDPLDDRNRKRAEWRGIVSRVELLSEKVHQNPGSVRVGEIKILEDCISGEKFYGVVSFDEVQSILEELRILRGEVVSFHKTGRKSVHAYDSDPISSEDVYEWIGDAFGKVYTLIASLFSFLWNLLKRAFGRVANVFPEYSFQTMRNIQTITAWRSRSRGGSNFPLEPEYPDQGLEPHGYEPVPFDQPQESDFLDAVPDDPPRDVNFGRRSRQQATKDGTKKATEYRNSHSHSYSDFRSNASYSGGFSSYSSRSREVEASVKSRLQNFGLVNGAGVNACFLNSLVQALRCNQSFVAGAEAHEAQHRGSGAGGSASCIMCLMKEIFADMKGRSASVEGLRKALGLEENRAEDPFEIFERIVNSSDEIKRFFMFVIEDRGDSRNRLPVAMFDIDFVNFFRKNFGDSLAHFIGVLNRTMAEPAISRVEDTFAVYLDTYGPVALRDFGAEVAELCRNPTNRTLFGVRFNLISFVCSQACGSIAHYVAFYYLPSEGAWVYCNDMTVETHSPDSCARKILECNFYPKLLFFKKD